MNKNDDTRQLIADVLKARGSARDADDLILPWQQLAAQLGPLIGEAGVLALFSRTLRLSLPQYAWLAQDAASKTLDGLFVDLKAKFLQVEQSAAINANIVLLETFSNLLSGLVGSAMTIRLLNSAWCDESGQGNTKEQR